MRITLLAVAMALFASVLPVSAQAVMQHYQLNIPRQSLDTALKDFAHQTGLQIARFSDTINGSAMVGPLTGDLSAEQALKSLLGPSGLSFKMVNDRTIAIVKAGSATSKRSDSRTLSTSGDEAAQPEEGGPGGASKDSFWSRFRLAQADQGSDASSIPVEKASRSSDKRSEQPVRLEEIIVTAQKREERLMDVPVPVTVISAETLAQTNQVRLEDYFSTVPGFSYSPGYLSQAAFAFRGIATNTVVSSGTTVAVTLDDVPFNGSVSVLSNSLPDLDPSDLARLEALRGPQGTLYGASSMGGLLKYVSVDPSTEAFSGRVQADANRVYNSSETGYAFRAAVNVPVSDTFAIRASGFSRLDPGYIDNVLLGRDDANTARGDGGRLSALWRPSDTLTLKVSALYQDERADSNNDVRPAFGDLAQSYIAGCCAWETQLQAYIANLNAKLGSVDLTSVTGYTNTNIHTSYDFTYALGAIAQQVFGVSGAGDLGHQATDRFTQEIRAAVPIGQSLEWLLGGFYEHEDSNYTAHGPAQDPLTGLIKGSLFTLIYPTRYSEYAGFTDLTVHFTDRFDVQLGARESHIKLIEDPVDESGLLYGGSFLVPAVEATQNVFTYLVTPRFKFSDDLMVYARIASGYRPGTFNASDSDPLIPRTSNPDKTENYEIGAKGKLFQRKLSFDASLYYIDWKGIQTGLIDENVNPATGTPYGILYTTNGARAKSEGVELSVEAKPTAGLAVSGWLTYDDAVLTEGFPATSSAYGPAGSRLPFSSRFSANLAVEQTFPVSSRFNGNVGAAFSYVGDRLGPFNTISERQVYPGYGKLDIHAGLSFQSWDATLYANNITDKRGLIGGGIGDLPPNTLRLIPPRTVGLSIRKSF